MIGVWCYYSGSLIIFSAKVLRREDSNHTINKIKSYGHILGFITTRRD